MSEPLARDDSDDGDPLAESILDNLSAWTVVALVIGLLYLVWATIVILEGYVGDVPGIGA